MANEPAIHVGTSGFSYDEWRPGFYPDDLKKADMLSYYGARLQACELNNTFYRMPSDKTVRAWNEQVPAGFRFAIKASRRISWNQKLIDCGELCAYLFGQLEPLGDKLGCVFYQLPKYVRCDLDVLRAFLAEQPEGVRTAFEFVHDSWHVPEVFDLLHARNATMVASDRDDADAPDFAAGLPWVYLRLRRSSYGDDELRAWRERIVATGVREAFVFFKHEDSCAGPQLAARFLDL